PAALAPVIGWLPAPVVSTVSGRLTSTNDVQVSSIPGVPYPVYIAGARITHMYPFGPLPGCAAMITLLSYDGDCCIGINSDTLAVTDPGRLADDLRAGLDDVMALRGGRGAARRRVARGGGWARRRPRRADGGAGNWVAGGRTLRKRRVRGRQGQAHAAAAPVPAGPGLPGRAVAAGRGRSDADQRPAGRAPAGGGRRLGGPAQPGTAGRRARRPRA